MHMTFLQFRKFYPHTRYQNVHHRQTELSLNGDDCTNNVLVLALGYGCVAIRPTSNEEPLYSISPTSFVTSLHSIPYFPCIGVNFGPYSTQSHDLHRYWALFVRHRCAREDWLEHISCTLMSTSGKDNFNAINISVYLPVKRVLSYFKKFWM